jgi:peptide/nickel transport system substrate-binding protein
MKMNGSKKTQWIQKLLGICILITLVVGMTTSCAPQSTAAPQPVAPTAAVVATEAPATTAPPTQLPPTEAVPVAKEPVFMTVNVEQVSTWMRNFNPFSPDVRYPAQAGMYEPLMNYNKSTGELVPWLATDYAWNADNTALTFKIRQGVKWSDGQPFTARDVVFTFDMLKNNPALATVATSILTDYVDSFTAPDDFTVEIKFKTVYTLSLYDLANQYIVPEHIWKDIADPVTFTNDNPVATGPFTEVTKFEDQIYVVEKNPYYWQEGKPYFQGLRYPAYPGNDQANLALVNGELDWAGNFVPDIEKTYVSKDTENFHYFFTGGDQVLLYINPAVKPFDNPEVRKAISMGIDRKMVINVAMYDYVLPSDATGLSEQYQTWKNPKAVDAGTWTNYDVAKANEILDNAGLKKGADGIRIGPDGKPMKYKLIAVAGWTDWVSACQIVAQNMKDLGIDISVETPEYNAWIDELGKGQHQWAIGWSSGGPTPYNFYRGLLSKQTLLPVGEAADENWNRFVDEEADKLMEEFVKTSDPLKQKEIMDQIQMIFVNDAPALPLFPGPDWYEYNTTRFTDWPTKENPYAPGPPYNAPYNSLSPLFLLTTVKPK